MPSSQLFLRELDKKLWIAVDRLRALKGDGGLVRPNKLIDDALEAVEKENPVASVCDRRTLKSSTAARQPHTSRSNRRRTQPRKSSDGRRPTLQLEIDPADLAGLIDLIATITFHPSVAVSASHETATVIDRRYNAKDVHNPNPSRSKSSSAPLGDLCAFAPLRLCC